MSLRRARELSGWLGVLALGARLLAVQGCSSDETRTAAGTGGVEGGSGGAKGGSGGAGGASVGGTAGTGGSRPGGAGGSTDASDSGSTATGGAPTGDAGDASDGGDSRVTAVAIDTFVTESGKILQPVDLSKYDLAAFVPDASGGAGSFRQYPPTITGPGRFELDVPAGIYYLRYSAINAPPLYVVTSARSLDLAVTRPGRPDAVLAGAGTTLVVNASGLNPWQDNDDISLYASNAGTTLYSLNAVASSGAPITGNTTLSALTVDYAALAVASTLLDGAKGDRGSIIQLVTRPLGGSGFYVAAGKVFNLPSFALADGQTTTVSGSFTDLPQSNTISVDWKLSEFLSLGPTGTTPVLSFFAVTASLAPEEGPYGVTASLVEYFETGTSDIATSFDYGNPFPGTYGRSAAVRQNFRRRYSLPTGTPLSFQTAVESIVPATNAVTMRPSVGPVSNLHVNAADALVDVNGVGRNPVISWSAPAVGSATGYSLSFWRLFVDAGATKRAYAGGVFTTSTSIVVPPGLLLQGEKYVIQVEAQSEPGIDKDTTPFKSTYPFGRAGLSSGVIAP